MANSKVIPVRSDLDLDALIAQISDTYEAKGFNVTSMSLGQGKTISFSKDDDGIKNILGLSLGIKVNITKNEDKLLLTFSEGDWMLKIVGLVVGWFLCLIPFFTAAYGSYQQLELPKKISNDIQMLAN